MGSDVGAWMKLYVDRFEGGTRHMSALEVGIYIRLLIYSWGAEGCPVDERRLARIAGVSDEEFAGAWEIVGEKWEERSGKLVQAAQERVREEQTARKKAAQEGGRKGGLKTQAKRRSSKATGDATSKAGSEPSSNASSNPSSSGQANSKQTPKQKSSGRGRGLGVNSESKPLEVEASLAPREQTTTTPATWEELLPSLAPTLDTPEVRDACALYARHREEDPGLRPWVGAPCERDMAAIGRGLPKPSEAAACITEAVGNWKTFKDGWIRNWLVRHREDAETEGPRESAAEAWLREVQAERAAAAAKETQECTE